MKHHFLIGILLLLGAQRAADHPYELKGEAPGMSLKQFKSNHKHVDCVKRSAALTTCYVRAGVSFAGVPAEAVSGSYQGISADFVNEQMVNLAYSVMLGSAKKVIPALKEKYGEPTENTETSATWKNSVGSLHVSEFWQRSNPAASCTAIRSELNNSSAGKDI